MLPVFAGYLAAVIIDGSIFNPYGYNGFNYNFMDITMMTIMGVPTVYGALLVFGIGRMVWTHNRKMGFAR